MDNFDVITPTVLTHNSERRLGDVLAVLSAFKEVVVLDSGSDDSTEEIARSFPNVKFYFHEFEGYGAQHRYAESLARNEWILSVDSDEVLTSELLEEIAVLKLDRQCVYQIDFDNYFNNRLIRCCGWYPDSHLRLYNRSTSGFGEEKVHEKLRTEGLRICRLKGRIMHYSYDTVDDFLVKMRRYSRLFARQHRCIRNSSVPKAVLHSVFAFFKSYIVKRGVVYGYEGFIISVYNAQTAFWKYNMLRECNAGCS